jgi:hypothetical protein
MLASLKEDLTDEEGVEQRDVEQPPGDGAREDATGTWNYEYPEPQKVEILYSSEPRASSRDLCRNIRTRLFEPLLVFFFPSETWVLSTNKKKNSHKFCSCGWSRE